MEPSAVWNFQEDRLFAQGNGPAKVGDGVPSGAAGQPFQPAKLIPRGVTEGLGEIVGTAPTGQVKEPGQVLDRLTLLNCDLCLQFLADPLWHMRFRVNLSYHLGNE